MLLSERVSSNVIPSSADMPRFEFGKNWSRFLQVLDDRRVTEAEVSLQDSLGVVNLKGHSFVDVGSGSGLFSLAARNLGAKVHSFDVDPESVACAEELRRRYHPADSSWTIEQGSVLDQSYLASLGRYDVVYSWGVLHHTGQLWSALDSITRLVALGGKLCLSIYNDQGVISRRWRSVKRLYNDLPRPLRFLVSSPVFVRVWGPTLVRDLLRGKPGKSWRTYGSPRGMSAWTDFVDWVGGYPFEVAKPEEVFHFYRNKGFELRKLKTCAGGKGCNEFVFEGPTE